MSKVKITGNASGTGTLTIAAPNTNTDRTLTLPDGAGEILTDASSLPAANLTGTLPAIDGSNLTGVGGGKVLQVVSSTSISTTYINSTSYVDTGLSISITPSSTSSKVLILMGYYVSQDDNDGSQAHFNLVRTVGGTSTEVYHANEFSQDASTGQVFAHAQVSFLDSPSTTSAVTYKSQGRTTNSNSDFRPRSASIVLMEIAG